MTAKRQVSYRWRLRELMAGRGMFTTSELVPLLAGRGISLSASQVHRLVTGTPERLSLPVLAALCDILDVTPADLIVTKAQNADLRKTGTTGGLSAVDTAAIRPRRAPERWRMRVCARCGRRAPVSANWPEGPVCWTCVDRALRIRGRCAGCGASRLLPGRRADGTPACRDCAGITRDFSCGRCGSEGRLHAGRLCSRCTLSDKLSVLLDDGSGTISEALRPLAVHLTAMPSPRTPAACGWPARRSRPCSRAWPPATSPHPPGACPAAELADRRAPA